MWTNLRVKNNSRGHHQLWDLHTICSHLWIINAITIRKKISGIFVGKREIFLKFFSENGYFLKFFWFGFGTMMFNIQSLFLAHCSGITTWNFSWIICGACDQATFGLVPDKCLNPCTIFPILQGFLTRPVLRVNLLSKS